MAGTVAERYLAQLAAQGVDTLFVNAGTDFAPIVEAYAAMDDGAAAFPAPVVCTHENLAAGMAHGAYLVSGRPQAVMFHVSVGTANAICAIANAARDNVPLLVTAGRSPILESGALGARDLSIHWAQEMFDQAGMLRELVKWDYELRDARQVDAVTDRALSLAMSHPRGPVYLSLPREVLAASCDTGAPSAPPTARPGSIHPDPALVAELAARLAVAEHPVIVTSASGADRASVERLTRLSERYALGIAEVGARYLNVPSDHPHHLGTNLARVFEAADVLVFLECDVPWIQSRMAPRPDTFVVQAGADPLFARYPMRSHRSDLTIASTPSALLDALDGALAPHVAGIPANRIGRILDAAAAARAATDRQRRHEADSGDDSPITKAFISMALGAALAPDDVVFNEYPLVPDLLGRTEPGTYFYLPPAGGLGWGIPAALGAKLAEPRRTVVAAVGDGAYLFANPAACHHAAAKHGLPVLVVVANNSSWGAVDLATRLVYPEGRAVAGREARFSDLAPQPDFAAYCQASGGHGEQVTARSELAGAIERALHAVRVEGRQALLDIRCT